MNNNEIIEVEARVVGVEPADLAADITRLKWFRFDQNNSGGYFIENDQVCEEVFIQAACAADAISKAEKLFAPFSEYCECCGERWSYYIDEEDGTDMPMIYGEPITSAKPSTFRRNARLHYFDGSVEAYEIGSGFPPPGLN